MSGELPNIDPTPEYYGEENQIPEEREDVPPSMDEDMRGAFTIEELINNQQLRSTDFRPALLKIIDRSLLFESTKRGFRILVNNYFSTNRFLTNLKENGWRSDLLASSLDLERDLLFSVTAASTPIEHNNPIFTSLIYALTSHTRITNKRAVGKDRERVFQSKRTTAIEQTQETTQKTIPFVPQTGQPPQKKKGFLSFM